MVAVVVIIEVVVVVVVAVVVVVEVVIFNLVFKRKYVKFLLVIRKEVRFSNL